MTDLSVEDWWAAVDAGPEAAEEAGLNPLDLTDGTYEEPTDGDD